MVQELDYEISSKKRIITTVDVLSAHDWCWSELDTRVDKYIELCNYPTKHEIKQSHLRGGMNLSRIMFDTIVFPPPSQIRSSSLSSTHF